jgi:hypothetical protein
MNWPIIFIFVSIIILIVKPLPSYMFISIKLYNIKYNRIIFIIYNKLCIIRFLEIYLLIYYFLLYCITLYNY